MKKYFNLKIYVKFLIIKFFSLISPIINIWEKKYYDLYRNQKLKHQPIFVIGAPRTGSTIFYQTLTNQLDVLYINNLICLFNKNLFFGFWLSQKLFNQNAHDCFESDLGSTSSLHSPSECGEFWYRWLPKFKHTIEKGECSKETIKQIRDEISAVINFYDKPLVIGNNNAGLRIGFLKEVFPDAKYIVIDRNPLFVAQSLLLARKKVHGNFTQWWGLMPKNYNLLKKKSFISQVVSQHYFTNKQIYQDLKCDKPKTNWIVVNYSEFSGKKEIIIEKIKDFINFNKKRNFFKKNNVVESKEIKIEQELIRQIKIEIDEKNWNDYSSET
tara:strand:- start:23894 stop:24874 length:981 start_codon:yes stop_codon:yes gene_type:complete